MPLYEYHCKKCGRHFEKIQKFSDDSLSVCAECGGELEQLLSSPAIQFKGSGWYITDYARKSSTPTDDSSAKPSEGDGKPAASSDAKNDGAKTPETPKAKEPTPK
ncbi:MAG: FmdB family zinc ribbon protein [Terriglobia bacterium]